MEDLLTIKQQPSSFKSPRIKNANPVDFPNTVARKGYEREARKPPIHTNEADLSGSASKNFNHKQTNSLLKDPQFMINITQKSITPKLLMTLDAQGHDILKRTDKPSNLQQIDGSRDPPTFPRLVNTDKNRLMNTHDPSLGAMNDEFNTISHHTPNAKMSDNKRGSQKLPFLNSTKVQRKHGKEKIRSLGLGKGEIDFNLDVGDLVNRTLEAQNINGAMKRNDKPEQEMNYFTGTDKSYDEKFKALVPNKYMLGESPTRVDNVGGVPGLTIKIMKRHYVGNLAKTVQGDINAEQEEDHLQQGSFSLQVSPVKVAQRDLRQKKKPLAVQEKRESSPKHSEVNDQVRDVTRWKQEKTTRGSEEKKLTVKKPVRKDDDKAQTVKQKKPKKQKEKEKEEHVGSRKASEDNMEGWDKADSEESYDRGEEEDEEANEDKDEEESVSKRVETKYQEDRAGDSGKDKNNEQQRTRNNLPNIQRKGTDLVTTAVANKINRRAQEQRNMDKDKDPATLKRENCYKEFMLRLNFSFNVQIRMPVEKTFVSYKYFLGKGNNSIMLKAMLKQRWWWVQVDNKDAADINFMWTQLKQNSFIEGLKQTRKTPFENLESSGLSSHATAADTTANTTLNFDSATECESDNDSDTRSVSRREKSLRGTKLVARASGQKDTNKAQEENTLAAHKRLFTSQEIVLMDKLLDKKGNMPLYSEDYEDIAKQKKGPLPQVILDPSTMKMSNHLENNFHLSNKKALLWNMTSYYEAVKKNVFDYLPLTFHVRNGLEDKEFQKFLEYFNNREKEIQEQEKAEKDAKDGKKNSKKLRNLWIVKPGENTNRGVGINVCNELSQIKDIIASTDGSEEENANGRKRTYLIQQYLDKPFLYNKRKFDIRCYMLITCINGTMKGYWYQDGYIRTATKEFSLKNVSNKFIHLTNDAIQKKAEDYGRFETGNKLSYNDFQKYLDSHHEGKINFQTDIYPQIRNLAIDSIKGVYGKIDPYRRENSFEVFGLDFMIDTNLKAWLIEVNTNPDINASSPVLTRVIPNMVENALRLTIDQMYPPPPWQLSKKIPLPDNLLENNKFELVFDEVEDGPALRSILQADKGTAGDLLLEIVAEEEEESEEEGKE